MMSKFNNSLDLVSGLNAADNAPIYEMPLIYVFGVRGFGVGRAIFLLGFWATAFCHRRFLWPCAYTIVAQELHDLSGMECRTSPLIYDALSIANRPLLFIIILTFFLLFLLYIHIICWFMYKIKTDLENIIAFSKKTISTQHIISKSYKTNVG